MKGAAQRRARRGLAVLRAFVRGFLVVAVLIWALANFGCDPCDPPQPPSPSGFQFTYSVNAP